MSYPQEVEATKLKTKLKIIFTGRMLIDSKKQLYLDRCGRHRIYYIDYVHTKGVTRCPICDKEFFATRKEYELKMVKQ